MTDMTPQTQKRDMSAARIENTNNIVDTQVTQMFSNLDSFESDLDAVIEILTDRVTQSTDVGFTISLARLMEVRMDAFKKRTDILKTLVNDKSVDMVAKKKSPASDLDSILSGASLGLALGATISTQKNLNRKKFSTIDVEPDEIEFEVEHLNTDNPLRESSIDKLLSGE